MGNHREIGGATTSPAQVVPEDLVDFTGEPSILESEDPAHYDVLLHRLAETVKPKDAIEWIWVSDVAQLVWEMRRLRGIRDIIVERETTRGLGDIIAELLDADPYCHDVDGETDRLVEQWNSGNSVSREFVINSLNRRGVDLTYMHALVYHKHLDKFTKLEGLIANLGRRRDSILREIERRRYAVARRPRDVTDAEFEITKSGTQPVGN